MKVDSAASQESAAAPQVEANRDKEAARAQRSSQPGSDRVELSTEAELLAEALRVAEQTSDVRQDLVEQMRARLARGEVGDDVTRLADSMIVAALQLDVLPPLDDSTQRALVRELARSANALARCRRLGRSFSELLRFHGRALGQTESYNAGGEKTESGAAPILRVSV